LNKNVFLSTTEKFKQEKNLLIDNVLAIEFFSPDLFRAAPYRLMLVLHKGALFHWVYLLLENFQQTVAQSCGWN
jgi:hypothetical protein